MCSLYGSAFGDCSGTLFPHATTTGIVRTLTAPARATNPPSADPPAWPAGVHAAQLLPARRKLDDQAVSPTLPGHRPESSPQPSPADPPALQSAHDIRQLPASGRRPRSEEHTSE